MGPKCDHCPVGGGLGCPGQEASRVCVLNDPRHADYRPDYAEVTRATARQLAAQPPLSPPNWAVSLALAFWDWAVSGFKMTSDAEQARRIAICEACPHFDAQPRRCRLCSCFMDYKTRLETSHCPDDPPRW